MKIITKITLPPLRKPDTMKTITLNTSEMSELNEETPGQGGFQDLLERLQQRLDTHTGELTLTDADLERIRRYAFKYGKGGWEDRLIAMFSRHLGPKLGR